MSNTGSHFFSTGFDLLIRQAAGTYSNRKMAYDVKFYQWNTIITSSPVILSHFPMMGGNLCSLATKRDFLFIADPALLSSHIFFQSMGSLLVGLKND